MTLLRSIIKKKGDNVLRINKDAISKSKPFKIKIKKERRGMNEVKYEIIIYIGKK